VQRAIVTGATGFLGQHLVAELRRHGVQVTALARRSSLQEQPWLIPMGNAPWSSVRLARIIDAVCPDVIFHLAGGAVGSPPDLIASNVGVTIALMRALQHMAARPLLVCCGSAAEYGAAIVDGVPVDERIACAPLTPYGTAKLAQTKAVLQFSETTGVPVLVNRIFNMIGPGMPSYLALADFAQQIARMPGCGGVLRTGDLHVFRDFIDVRHVATAFRLLANSSEARGIVNICTGEATELGELVGILIGMSGKTVTTEIRAEKLRPGELKAITGSSSLLANFGVSLPNTNYPDVVASVWNDARSRWSRGE
jgi:GDP-4-dehydro-6-deoxy-D-mannose reductase